jgi:hypothetical protein
MGRIKNFGDWKVPETLQGCISYRVAAINQIKRNKNDNRRLEELIAECDRRIEAKTKGEKHGGHTET